MGKESKGVLTRRRRVFCGLSGGIGERPTTLILRCMRRIDKIDERGPPGFT